LAFVQHHLQVNTDWTNVFFTDESYFAVGPDRRMIWRRPGDYREEVVAVNSAHPFKLMVWGGICKNFKSGLLIFLHRETMDAATYINKVWEQTSTIASLDEMFGTRGWILQQANAPTHHAKSSIQHLQAKVMRLHPTTESELKQVLQRVWSELTVAHINNLVASMPRRLAAVYNNNG
jgi:hypothetical protein